MRSPPETRPVAQCEDLFWLYPTCLCCLGTCSYKRFTVGVLSLWSQLVLMQQDHTNQIWLDSFNHILKEISVIILNVNTFVCLFSVLVFMNIFVRLWMIHGYVQLIIDPTMNGYLVAKQKPVRKEKFQNIMIQIECNSNCVMSFTLCTT